MSNVMLLVGLTKREIYHKYKGSLLGIFWALIVPLFNLLIYTLVFGAILQAKWSGTEEDVSTFQFALILFIGLTVHQIFAEMMTQTPSVIMSNQNFVKKVVFPLEILVPVVMGAALFNGLIGFGLIFLLMPFTIGGVPITGLLLPIVILPLCIFCLGVGWVLSSLGVYLRDVKQIVGPITMAALFLAPIFFPASILPDWIRPWVKLNPITVPVEQAHNVLIYGKFPDFVELGVYTLAATTVCILGYIWFQNTRKGFADVL